MEHRNGKLFKPKKIAVRDVARRLWRFVPVWILIVALFGCAGKRVQFDHQVDGMLGKANKEQFLKEWGPPMSRATYDQTEFWFYKSVALQFDQQGILRGWHHDKH